MLDVETKETVKPEQPPPVSINRRWFPFPSAETRSEIERPERESSGNEYKSLQLKQSL